MNIKLRKNKNKELLKNNFKQSEKISAELGC